MNCCHTKGTGADGRLVFELPPWLLAWEKTLPRTFGTDEAAMQAAQQAALRNIEEGTGGPFGAIVVETGTGALISVGVNLVLSAKSSVLHAEIVAIMRAQQAAGSFSVCGGVKRQVTLYTSAEPCAMCMGAIPWSGVTRLVCGASDEDVRTIGFDEGAKPTGWVEAYAQRGIDVSLGVLRADCVQVLVDYKKTGGVIY